MCLAARILRGFALPARRLWDARRGSVAQITAFALPCFALMAMGASEFVGVNASGSRLQSIADAGALEGAHHLSLAVDASVVTERTASFVDKQFEGWNSPPDYEGTYEIVDWNGQNAVRVLLQGSRPSFFGSLLPPGGWKFQAEATAAPVGRTPLCVLATGTGGAMIDVVNTSVIEAPDCGVHSNAEIVLDNPAHIAGRRIQAVLTATGGTMVPAPGTGAAPITDPFASMVFPNMNSCPFTGNGQSNPITYGPHGVHSLEPGFHCQPIIVKANATLVLEPGDHFFRKNLQLQGPARLTGEDVFLFFDHGSDPLFNGASASVSLVGRKSGPYAGMVMATIAGSQPNITLPGKIVERLLGVVYVRNGFLEVSGEGVAAEDSAWTVIVARQIITKSSARIRINADYEGSDVPVPNGVGPSGGHAGGDGTRLLD